MESQATIAPMYFIRIGFGLMVLVGLFTYFASFFVKEEEA